MKVLSLQQPWASLVVRRHKWIETRSWQTSHRGWIGIHASKGFPRYNREICYLSCFYEMLWPFYGDGHQDLPEPMRPGHVEKSLPLGAVVGVAELLDCVRIGSKPKACPATRDGEPFDVRIPPFMNTTESLFGDYSPGRYAWIFGQIRAIDEPIPANGKLGLWNLDHPELHSACATRAAYERPIDSRLVALGR